MSDRRTAFKVSPTNPAIGEIQTLPARKADMPYASAVRVTAPGDLLFISGATPSPLYHKHPHDLAEHNHPVSIEAQTRLAMENIKSILDHEGLAWTDIVQVTKYLTDMRDMDGMVAVLARYFGDWTPASTTVCVNQLSTPGARVELEMTAVYPMR
jgi:2-aminomuconate deaminase